jgi:hypothetical protein
MADKIQNLRDAMRPFLTIWFSFTFTSILTYGVISHKMDVKDAMLVIDGILGAVIGYHFGKSTKKDTAE